MIPKGGGFFLDGFFDGDGNGGQIGDVWKARICPAVPGIWSWRTIPGDIPEKSLMGISGRFECIAGNDPGHLVADGKYFRFHKGDYVYLQGNFLDFRDRLVSTHAFMSEKISDTQRKALIARQRNYHGANKINIYLANKGDYRGLSVTPWVGTAHQNDPSRFDLSRWKKYDGYIRHQKQNQMFAELWLFADDSDFGRLPPQVKHRLIRYAMARTSAFSHMLYVIALEWGEGWKRQDVTAAGEYLQRHNPWNRPVSVHGLPVYGLNGRFWKRLLFGRKHAPWAFSGENWASFIATQVGNDPTDIAKRVNRLATWFA